MAPHAAFWVSRPNQAKVMSTNMAAGQKGRRVELEENEIYGAELVKDVDVLTKSEATRWLKCRGCRNLSDLTLKQLKNK